MLRLKKCKMLREITMVLGDHKISIFSTGFEQFWIINLNLKFCSEADLAHYLDVILVDLQKAGYVSDSENEENNKFSTSMDIGLAQGILSDSEENNNKIRELGENHHIFKSWKIKGAYIHGEIGCGKNDDVLTNFIQNFGYLRTFCGEIGILVILG